MRPSTPTQIYGVFWIILPRIVFLAGNGEIFENHRSGDHRIVGGRRPLRLLYPHAVASEPGSPNRHAFHAISPGGTACSADLRRGPDAATPQLTAARTPEGDFDFNASFDWVRERFRAADAAIVNLETTLSESGPYTGYPCFRSPAALAEALDSLGVDITVLANNHCCDGGSKGIRTTIRELDRHGIEHTGVFLDSSDFRARHPLRFEAGGIRFALLNYTYGTNGLPVPSGLSVNPIDTVRIAADLAAVEHDGVDCVIACMHWGNEYERRPNKVQRQLAGFLRRHGVDLIVGSHPHVVQPYEQDSNGIVLYSLGNFVSNQRKRYCDGGIVATVEVTRSPDGSLRYSLELTPVWVLTPGYRITPSEVGDTLSMPADSRLRYERFMTDTRLLLGL